MSDKHPEPRAILRNPVHFLAFGFGAGLLPRAPGTWGTLVALPFYLLLRPLPVGVYLSVIALLFLLGIWLCERTARDLGVHDHPGIVWDEIVGYLLTMTLAPAGWIWVLLGFLLFRGFDIFKPWPIIAIDRQVKGGVGIMLDDLLAGLYGLMIMLILQYLGIDL